MDKIYLLLSLSIIYYLPITSRDYLVEAEIKEIHETFVKINYTDQYKKRYIRFPTHTNNSPWKWEGKDCARVIALLEFSRFVKNNHISSKHALAINGLDPEWHYLPHKKINKIMYTDNKSKYDLHSLNLDDKNYDFIMANQTLEHVVNPLLCLKNLYEHLAPNGILYLNVPVDNIAHSTPYHYYTGFTPTGLCCLMKMAGFEILECGQWGNLEYLNKLNTNRFWPDYKQLKNPGLNDVKRPAITWVFAKKIKE